MGAEHDQLMRAFFYPAKKKNPAGGRRQGCGGASGAKKSAAQTRGNPARLLCDAFFSCGRKRRRQCPPPFAPEHGRRLLGNENPREHGRLGPMDFHRPAKPAASFHPYSPSLTTNPLLPRPVEEGVPAILAR